METLTLTLTMIHAITVASITSCAGSRVICPHPCAWCGPAPALWRPVCLASSSCRRHEYSQCTRQTERDTDRETDVRQHHCLMPPSRGRGHNNILSSIALDFSSVLWHCWLGDRKGILAVGLLVVTIWLELWTTYSSSCNHHVHHP